MNEFEVHHLVSELVSLVGDTTDVDTHVDLLLKNRTPYITTQVSAHAAKRKITEFSSRGEDFLLKYDELKVRQSRNLDPLVYLLSRITEDARLCNYLQKVRPPSEEMGRQELSSDIKVLDLIEEQEVQLPEQGAVLTAQEIEQLKGKLEHVSATLQEKEKERLKKAKEVGGFPKLPDWLQERAYLSIDFCDVTQHGQEVGVSLGSLPVALQQHAVVQDFLYLMSGVSGRFIQAKPLPLIPDDGVGGTLAGHRSFQVDTTLEPSLLALLRRLLPLATHYSTVAAFIQDMSMYEEGRTNQALGAAMRGLLKEYLLISAQLETQFLQGKLTLQKLWYYVQPCLHTMSLLAQVAVAIGKGRCRGGKTLSTLHHLMGNYTGDERSQELGMHLATSACVPYFEMLGYWVFQGEVRDPYSEFMVQEHDTIAKDRLHVEYNDAYWERRYTICQDNIPSFLEQVAEKVLRAGKYLNVVCECGRNVDYTGPRQLSYLTQEGGYSHTIHQAYAFASKSLLQLMLEGEDLLGHLRSLKHYFLVDQGDLLVHFMDMAEEELSKPMADILPQRLESLLELAVRTSLVDQDPYKDNVRPLLVPYDLVTQLFYIMAIQPEKVGLGVKPPPPTERPDPNPVGLSGVEAFSLDYLVKWPLSLVISRKSLVKYQMLFRHLFFCRHVERELCASWTLCKVVKSSVLDYQSWYPAAFALLQRMLNFVQNLQYYMTFEVLEPNWSMLEQALRSASTIDDVLLLHNDFLDKCLRDCMLSSREVLKTISRLLEICICFTRHIQLARGHECSRVQSSVCSGRTWLLSESEEGDVCKMVGVCERRFRKDLVQLLDWLCSMSSQAVGSMVTRLDFNGFYHSLYASNNLTSPTTTAPT